VQRQGVQLATGSSQQESHAEALLAFFGGIRCEVLDYNMQTVVIWRDR
jgi:hypothetical protein